MRSHTIALMVIIVLCVGTGCTPIESTAPATPAAAPSPVESSSNPEAIALPSDVEIRLRTVAAEALEAPVDAVIIRSVERVEWSNACLEAAQADEMCAEVITPGYRAIFSSPNGEAVIHSDRTASSYRLVSP